MLRVRSVCAAHTQRLCWGHALLCPQVQLPLRNLLPGGDELLHRLPEVLQASEFPHCLRPF